jgi:RNA polymerase sigma factor (sigma-70 family)
MSLEPFEKVVVEHGPAILRVCRAVAGPEEAEDVWSETFLAALAAYESLRPDSRIEAWLVTIAHRKAIDHRRASARRPIPLDPLPEPRQAARHAPGRARGLWSALEALPARQRQTIAYHYLGGLSYRDVAAIIGGGEGGRAEGRGRRHRSAAPLGRLGIPHVSPVRAARSRRAPGAAPQKGSLR